MNIKKVVFNLIILLFMYNTVLLASSTDTCFDTDTKLMLHMNGTNGSTTFTDDSTGAKTQTANGNAQISTAQSKFGGASGLFDGTTDYVTSPDNTDFDIPGDFTVDFWVRFSTVANAYLYSRKRGSSGNGFDLLFLSNTLNVYINDTVVVSPAPSWTPTANTWYHLSVTRSGTSVKLFVDGSQLGTTGTSSLAEDESSVFSIGAYENGNLSLNGYIDEFRFIKGTAIWTANFTAPSSEYSVCTNRRRLLATTFTD